MEIRAVEGFLSRKGVLHAPLLEQSEWDGEHVLEGQEIYLDAFPQEINPYVVKYGAI